ncbi:MAG: Rrf2 family transcriptional regulator [Candidatus Marinimicrobia bacterium]|nr:Rrf2 family transcriptional regulator [Candidatus Neomarinimicrobiota bacterium]|tara:strand:+ start:1290 stop:1739 length:450 start_codon:yes stop_codon:yes gene_type:complete
MRLSMTAEYAIRAMVHLSSHAAKEITHISEISKKQEIPESILRKIMGNLVKLGFVYSLRGKGGGVQLARSGSDITLLDVIEGIEGKIFLNQCLIGPDFCHRTPYCPMHLVWREAQDKMLNVLSGKTIEQLATENKKMYKKYLTENIGVS